MSGDDEDAESSRGCSHEEFGSIGDGGDVGDAAFVLSFHEVVLEAEWPHSQQVVI